jgi:hypothetical protein
MFYQYPRESVRYYNSVLIYGHICGPLNTLLGAAILFLTAGHVGSWIDHLMRFCLAFRTLVSLAQLPLRYLMSAGLYFAGRGVGPRDEQTLANRLIEMAQKPHWRFACFLGTLVHITALISAAVYVFDWCFNFFPSANSGALTDTTGSSAASVLAAASSVILAPFTLLPASVSGLAHAALASPLLQPLTSCTPSLLLSRAQLASVVTVLVNYSVSFYLLIHIVFAADAARGGGALARGNAEVASKEALEQHTLTAPAGALPRAFTDKLAKTCAPAGPAVEGFMAANITSSNSNSNAVGTSNSNRIHADSAGDACLICYGGYTFTGAVTLLRCGHAFHAPCFSEWMRRSAFCPCCHYVLGKEWPSGGRAPFAGVCAQTVAIAAAGITAAAASAAGAGAGSAGEWAPFEPAETNDDEGQRQRSDSSSSDVSSELTGSSSSSSSSGGSSGSDSDDGGQRCVPTRVATAATALAAARSVCHSAPVVSTGGLPSVTSPVCGDADVDADAALSPRSLAHAELRFRASAAAVGEAGPAVVGAVGVQ